MIDFSRIPNSAFRVFGTPGVFTPAGGAPVNVTVVRRTTTEMISALGQDFTTDGQLVDLRVSDVAAPAEGDGLTIGADSYVVQAAPRIDSERLVWTLDLRPA